MRIEICPMIDLGDDYERAEQFSEANMISVYREDAKGLMQWVRDFTLGEIAKAYECCIRVADELGAVIDDSAMTTAGFAPNGEIN